MSANLFKILSLPILAWICAIEAGAHEVGAPFSSAFIEPILLHHAHIEDEQRINLVGLKDLRRNEKEVATFSSSLELAHVPKPVVQNVKKRVSSLPDMELNT